MQISSNTIETIVNYIHSELLALYQKEEIDSFTYILFQHYLGYSRSDLVLNKHHRISESEILKFHFAVKDLKKYKPIQYILEEAFFYGIKVRVNQNVLIPRPETEELVDGIIKENKHQHHLQLLDIGTGSGCIAIALKKHLQQVTVRAIDFSNEALDIARHNAKNNDVDIHFELFDILKEDSKGWNTKFNIIVSNPPYIPISEKEKMKKNVTEYEPHTALFVQDNHPLVFYNAIADFALQHLDKKGKIYVEIHEDFAKEVKTLFQQKGFNEISIKQDINGKDRMIWCSRQ